MRRLLLVGALTASMLAASALPVLAQSTPSPGFVIPPPPPVPLSPFARSVVPPDQAGSLLTPPSLSAVPYGYPAYPSGPSSYPSGPSSYPSGPSSYPSGPSSYPSALAGPATSGMPAPAGGPVADPSAGGMPGPMANGFTQAGPTTDGTRSAVEEGFQSAVLPGRLSSVLEGLPEDVNRVTGGIVGPDGPVKIDFDPVALVRGELDKIDPHLFPIVDVVSGLFG